ncbi:hypothetical protein BKA62DRAFT_669575 [Auriculariales sp. MPI-PUGE-AT-0066]|nr:hypothetical protein BKA62DRAFT_669575 [Auriculariales sp. MPI-PUGE-AT-0066]
MSTVPPPGTPPPTAKVVPASSGPNWGLIAAVGALGAAGIYYFQTPSGEAKGKEINAKATAAGNKVEGKAHDLQRDASQLGKDTQVDLQKRYVDARANVSNAADKAGNKAEEAYHSLTKSGSDLASNAQHKANELKTNAAAEAEKAKATASGWFSWGSKKTAEGAESVQKKAEETSKRV